MSLPCLQSHIKVAKLYFTCGPGWSAFPMQPKLASNLQQFSGLSCPSAKIAGMSHHAQIKQTPDQKKLYSGKLFSKGFLLPFFISIRKYKTEFVDCFVIQFHFSKPCSPFRPERPHLKHGTETNSYLYDESQMVWPFWICLYHNV